MPNWEGSTRRERLPANWPQLRAAVIIRDRGLCQWVVDVAEICGRPGNDVDHRRRGDDHSLDNLQLLCRTHHAIKTGREGAAARPSLYRPRERHPGLR